MVRTCRKCNNEFEITDRHQNFIICDNCKPGALKLYEFFVVEARTIIEISKIYNLSRKMIKSLLFKYGISKKSDLFGYKRKLCHQCNCFFYSKNDVLCLKCQKADLGENLIDFVQCKICGAKKQTLVTHVTRVHGISTKDYKEKFGVTLCKKLQSKINSKVSSTVKKLWETGTYNNQCWTGNQNSLEKEINNISPNIVYVGGSKHDHKRLWIRTSRLRNPDFVILDEDYCKKLVGDWLEKQDKVSNDFIKGEIKILKVIEHNGLHWHEKRFNGRSLEKYEQDMIEDYKKANIDCLVVWDFQLENDKANTYKRVENFVSCI